MGYQKNELYSDAGEYAGKLEAEINMLRTIIDSSEAGMYVSDFHTGEVLYINRKAVTLFGNEVGNRDELLGKACWELVYPESKERCTFCPQSKLVGSGGEMLEPYSWEHYFEDYGLWLRVVSQAIKWSDGRMAQINTFYDITEIKEMQEIISAKARKSEYLRSQQELQMILDNMPVAVRILNFDDGELAYTNRASMDLFNCKTADDLAGKTGFSFMPEVQPNGRNTAEFLAELSLQDSFQEVFRCFKLTGEPFDARITSCTIDYRGKKASLAVLEDITAEQETQMRLLNAAEKEREANKLKSSFLSNMSHEIRTPMNAIIGLTEIELRKKHSKESGEVYKKINISAKSLLQIVNDILDMSKIEADRMEIYPDEFELESVLNSALLVVTPRLEGKRVELMTNISRSLPRFLIGDKTRLWQMLKNYLDNAAKFTQNGHIILTVTEVEKMSTADNVFLRFEISDTGIGMTAEQIQKALLPFEQVYSTAQMSYMGTGLGLPLSKRICELMGGKVEIKSDPHQGTTVSLLLPFGRSVESELLEQAIDLEPLSSLRILAVDDDMISLEIIKALLTECGAECVTASSGQEAIDFVLSEQNSNNSFDIILLDYLMSGLNGLETARRINRDSLKATKLMMVTAYESQLIRDEIEDCGILDIIEKPFVPSLFYEKILTAAGFANVNSKEEIQDYKGFKNTKVLICEDNEINQLVVEGMLDQLGIAAVFADNGKLGIELLDRESNIDLIFMDVRMPVMDGFEASRRIRANPKYDCIPIISLTADAMTESIEKCIACGMNDFLSKPFVLAAFHQMLRKWLPEEKYQD